MNEMATVAIPSDNKFLGNKDISDRVYVWLILNSTMIKKKLFINKSSIRGAYNKIGINKRTFYKAFNNLAELGYIVENEYQYEIANITLKISKYKRYVSYDILSKLYGVGIENIIKVYLFLSSLYSMYGTESFFTYSTILHSIGYSYKKQTYNHKKVQKMLDKLKEIGVLKYCRTYTPGDSYQIKYRILFIEGVNFKNGDIKSEQEKNI